MNNNNEHKKGRRFKRVGNSFHCLFFHSTGTLCIYFLYVRQILHFELQCVMKRKYFYFPQECFSFALVNCEFSWIEFKVNGRYVRTGCFDKMRSLASSIWRIAPMPLPILTYVSVEFSKIAIQCKIKIIAQVKELRSLIPIFFALYFLNSIRSYFYAHTHNLNFSIFFCSLTSWANILLWNERMEESKKLVICRWLNCDKYGNWKE